MTLDIPNLRHLRAFHEVAQCRSISKAANQVFLSQPAITQAIAKLEQILDVVLFDRNSDGMLPTKAGQLFAARVGRALELIRLGTADAQRAGGEKAGRRNGSVAHLLTTTQLRALVAVAKARNFSLAARSIGTSQPALYRAARDLESLMGVELFEKTSQGIDLTRAGQTLSQQVKLAFAELTQGFAEVAALNGVDSGRIVVGSMPLSRHFILPSAITALSAEHPEVTVRVLEGSYAELLHGLRHGEIDFLIGALRDPLPVDDVSQEAVFDSSLAIVARSGHPLLKKKGRLSIDDLAAFPWVISPEGTPTRDHFEALFRGKDREPPKGLVESGSLVLVRGLLLQSDRLTLISSHQVRLEQELGLLSILPYDLPDTSRAIGITTRRDWRPTPSQGRLLELLRGAANHYSEIE